MFNRRFSYTWENLKKVITQEVRDLTCKLSVTKNVGFVLFWKNSLTGVVN